MFCHEQSTLSYLVIFVTTWRVRQADAFRLLAWRKKWRDTEEAEVRSGPCPLLSLLKSQHWGHSSKNPLSHRLPYTAAQLRSMDNVCLQCLRRCSSCLCLETEGKSCCTGSCVLSSLFSSSHPPCDVFWAHCPFQDPPQHSCRIVASLCMSVQS